MSALLTVLTLVPLDIPGFTPTQPGGFDKVTTLLGYIAWIVIICCAIGFMIAAGKLGLALRNGGEVEGLKGLVLALVGTVLVGGTTTLFNLLT